MIHLLDDDDADVADGDVGRGQLVAQRRPRELALQHLRLAQLPRLLGTCGKNNRMISGFKPLNSHAVIAPTTHMYTYQNDLGTNNTYK